MEKQKGYSAKAWVECHMYKLKEGNFPISYCILEITSIGLLCLIYGAAVHFWQAIEMCC